MKAEEQFPDVKFDGKTVREDIPPAECLDRAIKELEEIRKLKEEAKKKKQEEGGKCRKSGKASRSAKKRSKR